MAMATVVGEIGALATNITATALQRAEYVARDQALEKIENGLTADQKKDYNSQYYKDHPEEKANYLAKIDRENALAKNPEVAQLINDLPKDMTAGDRQAVMEALALNGKLGSVAQANQIYLNDQKKHGPGSTYATAAQAVSGLAVGIAGGNIQQGLSNAAAPYLAGAVGGYFDNLERGTDGQKHPTPETTAGRLLAHAAVGAAVAYASGNDATAGAAGAVSGEAMAMIVMERNYPGLTADDLTNEQKEHIRAIATLASGLVGAATGNSFEAATTAAAAGYNAAVNNVFGFDSWYDVEKLLDAFGPMGSGIKMAGKFTVLEVKALAKLLKIGKSAEETAVMLGKEVADVDIMFKAIDASAMTKQAARNLGVSLDAITVSNGVARTTITFTNTMNPAEIKTLVDYAKSLGAKTVGELNYERQF
jgi:hypothetical protein